jgi:serine protease AprX
LIIRLLTRGVKIFLALCLLVDPYQLYGQNSSYFVEFTDKNNTPYSIGSPGEFLTQRAIDRRTRQGISITEDDLPITPSYLETLNSTGSVSVRHTSRWVNGAIIQATAVDAEAVKLLPFVSRVEYIAPENVGGRFSGRDKFAEESFSPSDTLQQFALLGVEELRQDGYDGTGKYIAVLDGGFAGVDSGIAFQHLFDNNQVISVYDFVSSSENVYQYSSHGTEVLSVMAASRSNPDYIGIAPGASYLLFVTENAAGNVEYRIEEYWWLVAAEKADSLGVDLISTSLGYYDFIDPTMNYVHEDLDGRTAVITRAAQAAADRGIVFVTSAGNTGNKAWQKVTFPADVIDGLAVGSMLNEQAVSGFSPDGPSIDGRIKPDVMAVGSGTYVVTSDGRLVTKSGTSFSAPQITALAAAVWQAYPDLSAMELIDAMRMSASNSSAPNNEIGYGIPSYRALVNFIEHLESENWASIYPNPTSDKLTVLVSDPAEDPQMDFRLFNSNGQLMLTSNLSISWQNNRYILDVSTLPRGIYVLNLQSNKNYSQLKFAKL